MTDVPGVDDRLRVLEAVTDSALARLELDKIIVTLLDEVVDVLQVDTSAVLLHDPASDHLIATAAVGIEEEVWQGVRVPVGAGFAGRVAAGRQPVIMDRVDSSTVVNPLLWQTGIRALLGVPMLVQNMLVGVLHVGSKTARRFTDADVELLQLVADRLALAVSVQRSSAERQAAAALHRSLLPGRLPAVPGLEFAARYVPGANVGVGGDWYDVFDLPGDRIGIAIGDVVGHGLSAAVVMGRLRSVVRAYAMESADPGEVLAKVDRKTSHFEHGTMATIGFALVEPSHDRLRLALAGHAPPLLADPDRPAAFVDVPTGPPIGFGLATTHRDSGVVDLPPGGLMVFYTDGLAERRDRPLDDGMSMLRQAVTTDAPDLVCARVMAALVGTHPAQDDIALLVLRRSAT
ncbi:MAG TPA: GAF domain-containing SpoIIE family protein phosphatase [Actinophytocola sp.]|uniref:PP2C family protein-serine/threonine phosphatase n=1 Tax=Actinophytocola sp. TaxID=1872138 RepID=UPI002DDC9247|nr:GAF domain-containing SpoIIE family protein phosphatase [Actinophytocola sp.]HEV2783473.1 GAF domain-containing SpoIIE family protein phosphatase [Actinophytocola sp.]